ncbi:LOW QUALITY PROTEIN: leucine-rich repeat-containing protein 24-like [Pollicipes pollicipes]|uniref:LOW QUALITY PROTEIN: leucine-rich repeat-containing protein 24-like n=1 Tax=Pollicipes pollicipes TaxID=41117 RepID=UPI00188548E7|nr:LOW QUALITY PROTEIN: leucine-rich repeat-containing protein 24-like [Pollicipes pollicipes]
MAGLAGAAATLLLLALAAPAHGDFTTSCPAACKCMWVSGKRKAECIDIGLTAVPRGLSPDIQVLDLSGTDIQELPKDAFHSVGLEHLQKLYIRRSSLARIDRHAFRGLRLLIQLDLSNNAIAKLHPETFSDNEKLRQLLLSGNPLQTLAPLQFPPLAHLQRLDLSDCRLTSVAAKAFRNLAGLEKLHLNGNQLAVLESDVFQSLSLKWLTLHDNPWRCDCHLRLLRDWLVNTASTRRSPRAPEPERLVTKSWRVARSEEFACRPQIYIPEPTVVAHVGRNATLRCQISGNPAPDTNWVMSGRIIANNTRIPFTGQTYVIREEGTVNRWTNLTVSNITAQDAGQYLCVGVNPGGVVERNVTLVVPGGAGAVVPAAPGGTPSGGARLSRPLLLGLVIGAVGLLLLSLVVLLCCCYWRRRQRSQPDKPVPDERPALPYGASISADSKPERLGEYEKVPQTDIEMERVRTPAVLTQPRRAAADDERTRRYSLPDSPMTWDGRRRGDYPDLLHLPRRPGRSSPAGSSSSSTQPDQTRLLAGRGPEPVYDTLGPRTTADGSSRLSLSSNGPETLPPYYVALDAPT